MGIITTFLEQHRELEGLARDVRARLQPATLGQNAFELASLLSRFSAKLKVHLAMEDHSLYPALIADPNEHTRALARRFADEMGGLSATFHDYRRKWSGSRVIELAPLEFAIETREILRLLGNRIDREDRELYPALSD